MVCGGLVFLFLCCTLSFAVFSGAYAFNQDVSKWNTGAVTSMDSSKCALSLPLCGHTPSVVVFLNIRQLEFHRITILTRFVFCFVFLKRCLFCCCGWWVGLSFFCCTLLSFAVFYLAKVFNQDVSKWNTGAVTNMEYSKCTLFLSLMLWPRLPLLCF